MKTWGAYLVLKCLGMGGVSLAVHLTEERREGECSLYLSLSLRCKPWIINYIDTKAFLKIGLQENFPAIICLLLSKLLPVQL